MRPGYNIRFGYHKCLSVFMNQVFHKTASYLSREDFINHFDSPEKSRFVSISNQLFSPDKDFLADSRIVHLIRHPKDLIVSGYFYHKRGTEPWASEEKIGFLLASTYLRELRHILSDEEKEFIKSLPTMQAILELLDFNKGMMLEIVWRKYVKKFNPVALYQHPRVTSFKFEDIMDDTAGQLEKICIAWQLDDTEIAYYLERAEIVQAKSTGHIRDSTPYQYHQYFDSEITQYFNEQFHGIEADLDYPP